MPVPHDSWALNYDFVYETTFGPIYQNLTGMTIQVIHEILPEGTILDFGAGTGRLAIPLSMKGYNVISIEKSQPMAEILKGKALLKNLNIPVHSCSINEFDNGKGDLALALFTVLSYTITNQEMKENITNISRHLKPGGYFFFDLPQNVFFNHHLPQIIQRQNLQRKISIVPFNMEDQVYTYSEQCTGNNQGVHFEYEDHFQIRNWDLNEIDDLLVEYGLIRVKEYAQFMNTGARYFLYKKAG